MPIKINLLVSFLLFFLFIHSEVFSQTPSLQWQHAVGGTGSDNFSSIKKTSDGGLIAAGASNSNNGNVSGNHGGMDFMVVKFDAAGGIQWSKLYGGSGDEFATAVLQTTDGGYLVVGYTNSNDGQVSGNHGGEEDAWVIKVDQNGNLLWQKCFGGSGDDIANAVVQTNDGNYLVAGNTDSTDGEVTGNHGLQDAWLFKIDPTGNLLWQNCYGGSATDAFGSVQQTTDNGYIACGSTQSNNGEVTGFHGQEDYWVVKVDGNGTLQWQGCYGGGGYIAGSSNIIQITDGSYFVSGSIIQGNPGSKGDITTYYGNYDFWVVKLTSTGGISWQKTLGGTSYDACRNSIYTSDGGYVLVGGSASDDDYVSGAHGQNDFWTIKLDQNGNQLWQLCLGGTGNEEAYSIVQTGPCEFVLAGATTSDDDEVTGNHGGQDAWIVDIASTLTPSVSITSGSGTSICQGTSVTFTATPANGGSAPVYQWQKNGQNVGTGSAVYTDNNLANGDMINVVMTSNAPCATPATAASSEISMQVNAAVAPSVTITSGSGASICQGTSVTFTARPVNGGSAPVYQWQKNGRDVGTSSPVYTDNSLADGDMINVVMTSNAPCVTPPTAASNEISMQVNTVVAPSVTITSGSGTSICEGTPVTFTASPVNGGSAPVYQWQKNGQNVGTGSAVYTDNTLANRDMINVIMTSNSACATPATAASNEISMQVNAPVIPSVSITSGSGTSICQGTSVIFTTSPVNGGSAPVYQWQKNGQDVGTGSTIYTDNSLANGDMIKVVMTSNAPCATPATAASNEISMQVNAPVMPLVTITSGSGTSICQGTSVTFTASPVNGGSAPVYQWQKNGQNVGTGSAVYTDNNLANGDMINVVMTSNASCATPATAASNEIGMAVNQFQLTLTPATQVEYVGQTININTSVNIAYKITGWQPGGLFPNQTATSQTLIVENSLIVSVTGISADGCTGEASIQIMVNSLPDIRIPNTFTPNGDGINDTWDIVGLQPYKNAIVSVYTRDGIRVFMSRGYTTPWNGTYNDAALPTGVYYYIISNINTPTPLSGWLAIIR